MQASPWDEESILRVGSQLQEKSLILQASDSY